MNIVLHDSESTSIKENFVVLFLTNWLLNEKSTLRCDDILTISKEILVHWIQIISIIIIDNDLD